MHRIVFRDNGCQVLNDQDQVVFTGGFRDCERYLDFQENLQTQRARAARCQRGIAVLRDRACRALAPLATLFRRVLSRRAG